MKDFLGVLLFLTTWLVSVNPAVALGLSGCEGLERRISEAIIHSGEGAWLQEYRDSLSFQFNSCQSLDGERIAFGGQLRINLPLESSSIVSLASEFRGNFEPGLRWEDEIDWESVLPSAPAKAMLTEASLRAHFESTNSHFKNINSALSSGMYQQFIAVSLDGSSGQPSSETVRWARKDQGHVVSLDLNHPRSSIVQETVDLRSDVKLAFLPNEMVRRCVLEFSREVPRARKLQLTYRDLASDDPVVMIQVHTRAEHQSYQLTSRLEDIKRGQVSCVPTRRE